MAKNILLHIGRKVFSKLMEDNFTQVFILQNGLECICKIFSSSKRFWCKRKSRVVVTVEKIIET